MDRNLQIVNSLIIARDQIEEYVSIARSLETALDPSDVVDRANQVYPAIWDNLVAARAGLAELTDVTQFDEIRAALGGRGAEASGGLIDASEAKWDVAESLLRLGLVKTQQVSFSLNVRGVALADQALRSLHAAAPREVTEELARQAEVAAAMGLDRKRWRPNQRLVYGVLVALMLVVVIFVVLAR